MRLSLPLNKLRKQPHVISKNLSRLRSAQSSVKSSGSRSSSGSSLARTSWLLVAATLSKTSNLSSDIWTKMICLCTQSCMVPLSASSRISLICQYLHWPCSKRPRLKCATARVGKTRWQLRSTGWTPIRSPRRPLRVCSSELVASSSAASVTLCTHTALSWASPLCFALVRSR